MRYVGIDIGSEQHAVAIVDAQGRVLRSATKFREEAAGHARLRELLGTNVETLVAMEATGHYWKNLFAMLAGEGFAVALLNPRRTSRFAQEELERTKTDAVDALNIARFAAQKHPAVTRLPDRATDDLRELVRHRDRLVQDFGDRTRQLHRLVDLGFPEFKHHVHDLGSVLATTILNEYPTAEAFHGLAPGRLARLRYDGRHTVGPELARTLIDLARVSVGHYHSPAYRLQVHHCCEDLDLLRRRLREVDGDLERTLAEHEVGTLLTTIDGIGPTTAARIIAEVGDPAGFASPATLAAYVGVVPALKQSGKRQPQRAGCSTIGNARLRAALWMPTLTAVRKNPWLKAHYQRLRARGKLPKVALVACMHKLLGAVHSVARRRQPFVPFLARAEAHA
ncbi:MAG TPA: IS110 family transposase [Candidatus Eisenbacteria bacterium]|nr:IS110 family transposase [Candidatus Eisenbacteria bacterium]